LTQANANSQPANGLAVGDVDDSGSIDMVFGASPLPVQGTEIDYNTAGNFPTCLNCPAAPAPKTLPLAM